MRDVCHKYDRESEENINSCVKPIPLILEYEFFLYRIYDQHLAYVVFYCINTQNHTRGHVPLFGFDEQVIVTIKPQ